jgi:hypothetical protein
MPRAVRDQGVGGSNPLASTKCHPENKGLRVNLSGLCRWKNNWTTLGASGIFLMRIVGLMLLERLTKRPTCTVTPRPRRSPRERAPYDECPRALADRSDVANDHLDVSAVQGDDAECTGDRDTRARCGYCGSGGSVVCC